MNPKLKAKKHAERREILLDALMSYGTISEYARCNNVTRQTAHARFKLYGLLDEAAKIKLNKRIAKFY